MNLYILRHASAGTRRANPIVDVKRPLDKEGKQQCILVGSFLNALNVQFDRVVSSPLKRALQTASLVGKETGYEGKIDISEPCAPEASVQNSRNSSATSWSTRMFSSSATIPTWQFLRIAAGAVPDASTPACAKARSRASTAPACPERCTGWSTPGFCAASTPERQRARGRKTSRK